MKETYGFPEAIIPQGRLKGVEQDLLTVDYGGWLLACREDLPEELAYLLARISTEQREVIAAPFKDQPKHLQSLEIPLIGKEPKAENASPSAPVSGGPNHPSQRR